MSISTKLEEKTLNSETKVHKHKSRNFLFEDVTKSTSSCCRALAERDISVSEEIGRNEEPKHAILSMPKPLR
jgi:hypothetical protein